MLDQFDGGQTTANIAGAVKPEFLANGAGPGYERTARPRAAQVMQTDRLKLVLGFFAVGNLINGGWMLGAPEHWYHNLPAGVPDTGPFNEHFVRDLGALFFLMGLALAWAALRRRIRAVVLMLVSGFYVFHALLHVWDTARGFLGPEHWMMDAGGVYLPAVLLLVVTAWAKRIEPQ